MRQTTIKLPGEALDWIHNQPHHEVGMHFAKGKSKETGAFELGTETHVRLSNYHEKILIPVAMWRKQLRHLIEPNRRPFDTRMYALTNRGRKILGQYRNNVVQAPPSGELS